MMQIRRPLAGVLAALVLGMARVAAGPGEAPASAAGDSFDIVQYNVCGLKCDHVQWPSSAKTNMGIKPVNEIHWAISSRNRYPRAISLNEACGEALFTLVAGLPSGYNTFFLAARNFSSSQRCGIFGNVISVKSLGSYGAQQYCFQDGNGGTSSNGCAPSIDNGGEYRNMVCSKSEIYIEVFFACSAHTTGGTQAGTYQLVVDNSFGSYARLALGDLNVYDHAYAFENVGYRDAYAGLSTFRDAQDDSFHIDFGYFHEGSFDGRDSYAYFNGVSDHHLMIAGIHFK